MKIKQIIYIIFLSMILVLSSCDNNTECKHSSTKWIVDKEANCYEEGLIHEECTKCHEKLDEDVIQLTTHNYVNGKCTFCKKTVSTGFTYKLNDDEKSYSIIGIGTCTDTNILIPDAYQMLLVTSISEGAFSNCKNITSIVIPSSIEFIEENVFEKCTSLENIKVEDDNPSYKSIDGDLYSEDESTLIKYASGKEIKEFMIPSSVTTISDKAFSNSLNLVDIEIPRSVISIENEAFNECKKLENIYYEGTIEDWCNIKFESENSTPLAYANHFYIEDDEYEYIELTEIVLPDTLTELNYQIYGFNNVTKITIPSSIVKIGEYAFYNYENLKSVYYEGTIEEWCNIEFMGGSIDYSSPMIYCNDFYIKDNTEYKILTEIEIPDTITKIGNHQFEGFYNVTKVTLPNTITSIGIYAFKNCRKLTSIDIPTSLISVSEGAFSYCMSLEEIILPDTIETMKAEIFEGCCNLNKVVLPSNLTIIEKNMFLECSSLTNIILPTNITSIEDYAFYLCSNLTTIELPESVTYIGEDVFYDCHKLKYNEYKDGNYLGNNYNPYLALISIKNTEKSTVEINQNTKIISGKAFYNYSNLTSIEIPSSIITIGSSAFEGCANLTNIEIPSSIMTIGSFAFEGCTNLTSIIIPSNVIYIGNYAFSYCGNLTIYCETSSKPSGWASNWSDSNYPVIWNYNQK